jgi:DNA-binding response OmpR family regulator
MVKPVLGGTETILVVEDDPGVRSMVADVLTSNGYRVITASDGKEAVETFREHQEEIDLVILDVVLPEMSGRAVFERIRTMDADVPVVFSTGYAAETIDAAFLADNGLRLIRKPYAPHDLRSAVRETLDQQPTAARHGAGSAVGSPPS